MDHEPETGLSEGEEDLLNDMGEAGTRDAIYRAHPRRKRIKLCAGLRTGAQDRGKCSLNR
jgi:hypothetical protein